MKSRIKFFFAVACLTLLFGIAIFLFSVRSQETLQVFPATIKRDCAPWDGSAFTISIPAEESVIQISIYQSPEIKFPVRFSFPDETMTDGNALLLLPIGSPEQLFGKVSFPRIEQEKAVEGEFDLATRSGQLYKGKFKAEWEDVIVYCG